MLFIYRVLPLGGIETFFLRMAKERSRIGKSTTLLLLSDPDESNQELLSEIKKYAKVYFYYDVFYGCLSFNKYFPLLAPMKSNVVADLYREVDQVHAFGGMHALLADRLSGMNNKTIPLTIGFYHYNYYLWGGAKVAYHEKMNRDFVFNYLPKKGLLFFSEGTREFHAHRTGLNFSESQTFRLGVVDKKEVKLKNNTFNPLRIIAVGRLVEFKTYNNYMIDVIKSLVDKKYAVEFHVYGEGPLRIDMEDKINRLSLNNSVCLKGGLEYSLFDETVSSYDLFIGSGTAIIQAASLGVPAIVGVENVIEPKTYGYFSDVFQYEYNLKGLDLPLKSVESIIINYFSLDKIDRLSLREKSLKSVDSFTNESCQKSFDKLKYIDMPKTKYKLRRWRYELSRALDQLHRFVRKNHPYNLRNEQLQRVDKP